MALYSYVKTKSFKTKRLFSTVAFLLIFSGLGIIVWTILPILSFEIVYTAKFNKMIQPVPNSTLRKIITNEISSVLGVSTDYTKASTWFPKAKQIKPTTNALTYKLSIPKLKIEKANVLIGSDDLEKSLIHFTGPLPGKNGSPIIFGHSTIPWIYNPKDYKTIFTKLPELEEGDEIFIFFDNITYRYKVIDMKVVHPEDLSVLEQQFDYPYITLITCVPPGTYLKRLVVVAKLADL